jgi:PKD repeat protein
LDPKSASAQVPLEWRPDFTIFKSAIRVDESGDCIIDASKDIIEYRIVVKNDGNVDIHNLVVNDSLINLTGPVGNNTEIEILSPGDTWEYTGNYTVTQDDINNKKFINNTAIVSSTELPEKNSSVSQPIVSKTGLTLYKSVIGIDEVGDRIINTPGDIIQYQVAVKNNGNVKLTGFSINDPMVNLTKSSGNSDMLDELLPGELRVYTGNYTVTQQDMENIPGIINNTVVASSNQLPNESSSLELPVVHTLSTVVASEPESSNILPIANFSANVTGGYAPLTVQFIDLSQNATSRIWDFNGDGTKDSSDASAVYTYTVPGTYTVNLTVNNGNKTDSKAATITVLQEAISNSSESSSGSSYSSGGSSSGSGGSINRANVISNNSSTENSNVSMNISPTQNSTSEIEQSSIPANDKPTPVQTSTSTPVKEGKKTPGFELICGITVLLAVYLYRKN